jgi:hypothetical protein
MPARDEDLPAFKKTSRDQRDDRSRHVTSNSAAQIQLQSRCKYCDSANLRIERRQSCSELVCLECKRVRRVLNPAPSCPIENCTSPIIPRFHNAYRDLQNHLWGAHGISVEKSHAMARALAEPPKQTEKRNTPKKAKVDKAKIEFEKKQLHLSFRSSAS